MEAASSPIDKLRARQANLGAARGAGAVGQRSSAARLAPSPGAPVEPQPQPEPEPEPVMELESNPASTKPLPSAIAASRSSVSLTHIAEAVPYKKMTASELHRKAVAEGLSEEAIDAAVDR